LGAGISCVTASGEEATIAGTAIGDDAASANQINSICVGGVCDRYEYEVNTLVEDANMAADASVSEDFDDAGSVAVLTPSATISYTAPTYTYSSSNAITNTNTLTRIYDGDATAHAESFITDGSWTASAGYDELHVASILGTQHFTETASVSGDLSWIYNEENGAGVGGGAFLKDKKTGPSSANTWLTQSAILADPTAIGSYGVGSTGVATSTFGVNILGPKASGADAEDGSGVYGAYVDLNKNVANELDDVQSTLTDTSVDAINSYLWVDGTSTAYWQGYGFDIPSTPTFVPTGILTVSNYIYTASPTQRGTSVTGTTSS